MSHILYVLYVAYTLQFAEALRYKPEDNEFDSRWCHCNFLLL
jgi:hypothetical protein